jgi:hypothetical protein
VVTRLSHSGVELLLGVDIYGGCRRVGARSLHRRVARSFGYNGGQIFGLNKMQFQFRGAGAGDQAFIDDITYSSVPAPGAIALLGAAVPLGRRRR